jgi:hypothetical protein
MLPLPALRVATHRVIRPAKTLLLRQIVDLGQPKLVLLASTPVGLHKPPSKPAKLSPHCAARRYESGALSAQGALRFVFRDKPVSRAIALIGLPRS